MFRGLSTLP